MNEPDHLDPAGQQPVDPARVGARRAPRLGRFLAAGALLGALVGALASLLGDGTSYRGPVAFFLALAGAMLGAMAGAAGALFADKRSRRGGQ